MFQYNNTFLASDITDIPANKLNLLSQVITFIPKMNDDIKLEYDNHKISALTKILCDHIYTFEGSNNEINLYYKDEFDVDENTLDEMYHNNDQQGLIKNTIEEVDFDSSRVTEVYLNIKNKLHMMSYSNRHNDLDIITENSYYKDITDKLYRKIFGENGLEELCTNRQDRTYGEKNYSMQYLYVKLNKNNVIVFVLSHDLNPDKFNWRSSKMIFFLSRNKETVKVEWNFDETLNLIKKNYDIWDFNLESFEKYLDLYHYGTEEYINNRLKLGEVSDLFSWSTNVKKFFEPIYINSNLNLEIYLNITRSNSYTILVCVLNGKIVTNNDIKQMENAQEILEKQRIANDIREFIQNNKTGINPNDGNFYYHGEINQKSENGMTFQNDLGFIFNYDKIKQSEKGNVYHGQAYFYVIDGYYVKANANEKKELTDAVALMNQLSSWANSERVV